MPTSNVAAGVIGGQVTTLTAATVQGFQFVDDLVQVEVISDGAAPIWWTCDGTIPAVGVGYYIPGSAMVDSRQPVTSSGTLVQLYSTGTPTVRVQRAGQ